MSKVELKEWLKERRITEIELLVPDMAGIARGKIFPTSKFLSGLDNDTLRLPESVFGQMVTGADADTEALTYQAPDMILVPDPDTICVVPWYREPTAQIVCDCADRDGKPHQVAPRQILKNILAKYDDKGWRPVVAPELEFFLAQKNIDPDYPLLPPAGKAPKGKPRAVPRSQGFQERRHSSRVMNSEPRMGMTSPARMSGLDAT